MEYPGLTSDYDHTGCDSSGNKFHNTKIQPVLSAIEFPKKRSGQKRRKKSDEAVSRYAHNVEIPQKDLRRESGKLCGDHRWYPFFKCIAYVWIHDAKYPGKL